MELEVLGLSECYIIFSYNSLGGIYEIRYIYPNNCNWLFSLAGNVIEVIRYSDSGVD